MAGKQILMIDDEADFIESIKNSLQRHGYEVHTAANGEEGLKKFAEVRPDVVFLDIMMPKMDGFQVLRRLRESLPGTEDIPIIMFTGKRDSASIFKSMDYKVTDFIMKPCTVKELLDVLNKYIV